MFENERNVSRRGWISSVAKIIPLEKNLIVFWLYVKQITAIRESIWFCLHYLNLF